MTPIIVIIAIVALTAVIACGLEYMGFNRGYCRHCGRRLKLFDIDSQGGRGYICDACRYSTWVSYGLVDKNFKEEEE